MQMLFSSTQSSCFRSYRKEYVILFTWSGGNRQIPRISLHNSSKLMFSLMYVIIISPLYAVFTLISVLPELLSFITCVGIFSTCAALIFALFLFCKRKFNDGVYQNGFCKFYAVSLINSRIWFLCFEAHWIYWSQFIKVDMLFPLFRFIIVDMHRQLSEM